jgi:hypothetical protein
VRVIVDAARAHPKRHHERHDARRLRAAHQACVSAGVVRQCADSQHAKKDVARTITSADATVVRVLNSRWLRQRAMRVVTLASTEAALLLGGERTRARAKRATSRAEAYTPSAPMMDA